MDKLTALRVFVAVVEENGFAAAAERLGLSRTMVSKHVRDLEEDLSARLLNRTTRRVSPTGTGNVYYERARQILGEIEEADNEASRQSLTPSGRLRVNAPMSFGISHVAPILKAYMDRYPDVEIELALNDRRVDLVDEGFDMAVRIGTLSDSSLIARRLSTSRIIACAAPAYIAEHGAPAHPHDLADHACLVYTLSRTPQRWRFLDSNGEEFEVQVNPHMLSNNGSALTEAAVSGLGIVLQPDFIVHQALEEGRLREILQEWPAGEIGIHAVYPHTRLLSARVRTFIDHLVSAFEPQNRW